MYNQGCMSVGLFTKWRSQVQPELTARYLSCLTKISVFKHKFNTFLFNNNTVNYNVKGGIYQVRKREINMHGQYFHGYCTNKS